MARIIAVCAVMTAGAVAQPSAGTVQYVCPPCPADCHEQEYTQPGTCPVCGMTLVEKQKVKNVAILLWPGVELLDFAGPGEVFTTANGRSSFGFRVYTVAASREPLVSQGFLTVVPQYTIADCPKPDILVIPGDGLRGTGSHSEVLPWVKRASLNADTTLTVCTGALLLARTGLLDGMQATTYHTALDTLKQEAPEVTVRARRRLVESDDIVTTAGVSAGIDGALHVLFRLDGMAAAQAVADYMEYRWDSAYLTAQTLFGQRKWEEAARAFDDYLRHDPEDPDAFYFSGVALVRSGRHADAVPRLRRAAELGYDETRTQFLLAVALAGAGEAEQAVESLRRVLPGGMVDISRILGTPEFNPLRTHQIFRAFIQENAPVGRISITPRGEQGEALVVSGEVKDGSGTPAADVLVYLYHTDAQGRYGSNDSMDESTARLFGYVRTAADGRFEVRTIRPGGYPESEEGRYRPQHVHAVVSGAGFRIHEAQIAFDDDPRLDDFWREKARNEGIAIAEVTRDKEGVQRILWEIKLLRP